jgi:GAF domain-containing protein
VQGGRLLGVLDLDSPKLSRFDHEDRDGLEAAVNVLLDSSQLGKLAGNAI